MLTYVLANGYEKTISFGSEKLFDFLKWLQDDNSSNYYELEEAIGEKTVLFKDSILSVIY